MLTPEQKATLQSLHEGRTPENEADVRALLEGAYLTEHDGGYRLTDAGLNELRLARGFGEAIADAIVPGVGARDSLRGK
mgnify:CR=1 FL=1